MHSGFNRSWTKNNLNGRVIDRVLQIVKEALGHQDSDRKYRIMVSGEHHCTLSSTAAQCCTAASCRCTECVGKASWQQYRSSFGASLQTIRLQDCRCPCMLLHATSASRHSHKPCGDAQGIRWVALWHSWRHTTSPLQQLSRT